MARRSVPRPETLRKLSKAQEAAKRCRTWADLEKASGLSRGTLEQHGLRPGGRRGGEDRGGTAAPTPDIDLTRSQHPDEAEARRAERQGSMCDCSTDDELRSEYFAGHMSDCPASPDAASRTCPKHGQHSDWEDGRCQQVIRELREYSDGQSIAEFPCGQRSEVPERPAGPSVAVMSLPTEPVCEVCDDPNTLHTVMPMGERVCCACFSDMNGRPCRHFDGKGDVGPAAPPA